MDSLTVIGIGILILILIFFIFTQIHLKEISFKNQQNINGISHVWGILMELKLDLQMLEDKLSIPNINKDEELLNSVVEE
jgi:hypothetical protein